MGHSLWGFKASLALGRGHCGHRYLAVSFLGTGLLLVLSLSLSLLGAPCLKMGQRLV